MFVERVRQFTLLLGAVAAAGLAEQHHDPAGLVEAIPGGRTPLWTCAFAVCSVMCLFSAVTWPRHMRFQRLTAVVFASTLAGRGFAILAEYGTDLWGTVAQIMLTSSLIVASWSWSGETMRKIEPTNG